VTKHPNMIDLVKPDGPGLTKEEHQLAERKRDELAEHNLRMIQSLNRQGVQVDVGLEAITQFRRFLEAIGVINHDQRLAAETMWEASLNQQLKFSLQQVRAQQLATPPQGLIIPNGG
jgi:hypothetical protein